MKTNNSSVLNKVLIMLGVFSITTFVSYGASNSGTFLNSTPYQSRDASADAKLSQFTNGSGATILDGIIAKVKERALTKAGSPFNTQLYNDYIDAYLNKIDTLDNTTKETLGSDYTFLFQYIYPRVYELRIKGDSSNINSIIQGFTDAIGVTSSASSGAVIKTSTINSNTVGNSINTTSSPNYPTYSGQVVSDTIKSGTLAGEFRSNEKKGIVNIPESQCISADKRSADYFVGSCVIGSTVTTYDLTNEGQCYAETFDCQPAKYSDNRAQYFDKVVQIYSELGLGTPKPAEINQYALSLMSGLSLTDVKTNIKREEEYDQKNLASLQGRLTREVAHSKGLLADGDCISGYVLSIDQKSCINKDKLGEIDSSLIKTDNTNGNNIGLTLNNGIPTINIYDARGMKLTGLGTSPTQILENLEKFDLSKTDLEEVMAQYKKLGYGTKIGQYDLLVLAQGGMGSNFDWTQDANLSLKGQSASVSLAESRIAAVKNGLKDVSILSEPIPVYSTDWRGGKGTYIGYILPASGSNEVHLGNLTSPDFDKSQMAKVDENFIKKITEISTTLTTSNTTTQKASTSSSAQYCGGGSSPVQSSDGKNTCQFSWPSTSVGQGYSGAGTNGGSISATCSSAGVWENVVANCPSTSTENNIQTSNNTSTNSSSATQNPTTSNTTTQKASTSSSAQYCGGGSSPVQSSDGKNTCQFSWPSTSVGQGYSGAGTNGGSISATCSSAGVWENVVANCP